MSGSGASVPAPSVERMLPLPVRALLLALAVLCVVLGGIGVVVPGMPSTEFILIAAWAAAYSSPRFLAWLEARPLFGPALRNWRNGHRVSRRAKWGASVAMTVSAVTLFAGGVPLWPSVALTLLMMTGLIWLWRRPEPLSNG